jgi:hypothetical protein
VEAEEKERKKKEQKNYCRESTQHAPQRGSLNIKKSESIVQIFGKLLSTQSQKTCDKCDGGMIKKIHLTDAHPLLMLHVPFTDVKINRKIKISGKTLTLKGAVYYGEHHYTSRIVTQEQTVWFHDGMVTGGDIQYQKKKSLAMKDKFFNKCKHNSVTLLIYAIEQW